MARSTYLTERVGRVVGGVCESVERGNGMVDGRLFRVHSDRQRGWGWSGLGLVGSIPVRIGSSDSRGGCGRLTDR